MMMVIFHRDGWNRKDNMKKVAHSEYMLVCEYCGLELEEYDEKLMEKHEANHRKLLSISVGSRVRYGYSYETSDWGRPYTAYEERKGKLIRIKEKSDALIETDEGERIWVDMDQVLGKDE